MTPGVGTIPTVEYQALYRKYRPQRFAEIVGQDHVTLTLAREVQQDKVAHAYLFAGPRGTGKTTTARIIAKALNCADRGIDGEPCNQCPSCLGITEGTSLDVIELDAASHNKVEDIREIRANVGTVASIGGARRVYILDEAHMLSRAASNALLKTLEEPPAHAHFVLATTEPYKLPPTIRSRAQRFDFHPIGSEVMIDHLSRIATSEGYQAASDGLSLIARHARGSARDALGLLEQVAALGAGKVEARGVTRALGLADADAFAALADAVAGQDAPAALGLVASIAAQGADLRRFAADALEFFRGVFLAQYAPTLEEIVDEPADVLDEWRSYARKLEPVDVLRCIDQLGAALTALREGREERLVLELTLLRLVRPETAIDATSLVSRLDRLEQRLRLLQDRAPLEAGPAGSTPAAAEVPPADEPRPVSPPSVAADRPAEPTQVTEPAASAEAATTVRPAPEGLDLDAVDAVWPPLASRVREEAGPRRYALFRETRPVGVEGATVVLGVPAHLPFHLAQLQEDDRLTAILSSVASDLLGGGVEIAYRAIDGEHGAAAPDVHEDPDRAPDKDELDDAGDAAIDPTGLVVDLLGGEIVEE